MLVLEKEKKKEKEGTVILTQMESESKASVEVKPQSKMCIFCIITPNLCCDETKNRGTYTHMTV